MKQELIPLLPSLLRLKFELGLFDDPYIDASKATQIVGKPEFVKAGEESQRRAITLFKNDNKVLPLKNRFSENLCKKY